MAEIKENASNGKNGAEHYDVGIFGWWYNFNYGANVTYFALNRAIRKLGKSVVMLWRSAKTPEEPDTVQMQFAKRYYKTSPRLTKEELPEFNNLCDAYLLGSDQLWNPALERFTGDQFFLSFADRDKLKLAYAQSFGNYRQLPVDFAARYLRFIQDMDKISVREDYAVGTCKNSFGVDAEQVCDPVFLIEPSEYDEMLPNADIELPEHYVLDFFLNPNEEKISISRRIRKDLHISDYLNFTDLDKPERFVPGFIGEKVEVNSRIENLVKAYKNADFVVTDSFHGTCLALIFNKPFISIANVIRGEGRFRSVLTWAKQMDRLIYTEVDLEKKHLQKVDFTETNRIIAEARKIGIEWLREGLNRRNGRSIDTQLRRTDCAGCAACLSACPKGAISLKADDWGYYRSFVDHDKCVNCGKCVQVCPALHLPRTENDPDPECFEFVASDDEVLMRSTSGGIFETMAKAVFAEGGAVCGAAWDEEHPVRHIVIESPDELYKLQKSKYLQSFTGDCLIRVKKLLDAGRKVLFTGTPCQVYGLRSFLGKEYENLLAVDIFCGNAPSALFFKKYCEETYPEGLSSYEFRHKTEEVGWSAFPTLAVTKSGEKILHNGPENDDYQKVYHKHIMCAYHCQDCRYQAFPRAGDLSIGDFWGIGNYDTELDRSKGVSIVLCNDKKGRDFFDRIGEDAYRVKKQVPAEWMGGNGCSQKGGKNWASPRRDYFYAAILTRSFSESIQAAFQPVFRKKAKPGPDPKYQGRLGRIRSIIDTFRWALREKGPKKTLLLGYYKIMRRLGR